MTVGGAKSGRKGKKWERDLCKMLGERFGGAFIRVPNSGAFLGGKNAQRKSVLGNIQVSSAKGDIMPPDHMTKLVIEAKSYKDFRFHQLLEGNCPQLDEWIGQAKSTVDAGDIWFVVFKIDRKGIYVAVLEGVGDFRFANHAVYHGKHGKAYITGFVDFLDNNQHTLLDLCSPECPV